MFKLLVLSCTLIASVPQAIAQEAQTLKERLSDKASDAQRVDNCHVPPERRGALPRPDCAEKPRPPIAAASAPRRCPPPPPPRKRQGYPGNERRLRNWSHPHPGLVMAVLDTAIHA